MEDDLIISQDNQVFDSKSDSYKYNIISRYINSPAGKARLAKSMVNPLRTRLDYTGIARRALVVDKLPDTVIPVCYDKDIDVSAMLSSDNEFDDDINIGSSNHIFDKTKARVRRSLDYHNIPKRAVKAELVNFDNDIIISPNNEVYDVTNAPFGNIRSRRVIFPTFEMVSNPTIKLGDIKRRRFTLMDRAIQTAKAQIAADEDSAIFDALDKIGVTKE